MNQRERFEAWAMGGGLPVEHAANIDYFFPVAWATWKAAEAAALERAAQVCERIGSPVGADDGYGTRVVGTSMDAARAIRKLAAPVERGGDKS
jgi:hypothetical protein